ncbi:MAG: hypothetical protein JKY52_19955 [Flavobacteriales bacterium]|nr:hypothetical protein [Flavobacteriales bacterium]
MIALENNNTVLKGKNKSEKRELKKAFIPQYIEFIKGYIKNGENYLNLVLVTIIIWLLDTEDFESALELAMVAVEQDQPMPERFKRDLATVVAETVFDWANEQYRLKQSAYPYFEQITQILATDAWHVEQIIVHNKIYKLAAMFAERDGDDETALEWYDKCIDVNPERHGIAKKRAKVIERMAETNTPDTPDTPETPETPETPDTPDTPDTPETPETPETPDT